MAKSKPQTKSSAKPAANPAPILDIQMIPVSKLTLCPKNVRKTPASKQEDAELYASIKAIGLKQNVLVHPVGDKFHVHAGGRRLYTVQQLIKEKHYKTNHQIQCVVEDADQAEETSAAENMIRAKMHPADEFTAFAEMRNNGRTEKEIATKFGITVKTVHQRLKLAGVAPEVMAAFRNGDMSLECVMAFTIAKDPARQIEVLKSVSQEYQMQAYSIRQKLLGSSSSGNSKFAKFVGLAAYKKAGGTVLEDLFSDDSTVHYEDSELLERLALEKLLKLAKAETKIWKWAEADIEADYSTYRKFGRVYPKPIEADPKLQTELDGLRELISKLEENYDSDKWTDEDQEKEDKATDRVEEIETLISNSAVFTDEDHKLAGCIVTLSFRGEVHVEGGLVRPEDIPAEEPVTEDGDTTEQFVNGEAVSGPVIEMPSTTSGSVYPQGAATVARKEQGMSQALAEELRATRHQIMKAHLAADPETAYDTMLYAMCCSTFSSSSNSPLHVSLREAEIFRSKQMLADTIAHRMLEAINDGLNLNWMEHKSPADFQAMTKLKKGEKEALFAWCTAHALHQQLSTDTATNKVTEHLGERLQIDVAACWRPTADNYWGRVNKAHALKMAKELIGASWSDDRSSLRKPEIAKSMENAFGETAHEAIGLNPEIADRTSRWLPDGMSFGDQEIVKSPVSTENDAQCFNDPSASPKALPSFMDAAA